jgi:hypothetical protein
VGLSLAGKTLGIVGLGRLGASTARYAAALDMIVIAWSPNLTEARGQDAGARLVGKSDLMAESDAIPLHAPYRIRSGRDLARLLPAQHRECSRLPEWRSNQNFEHFLNVSTC